MSSPTQTPKTQQTPPMTVEDRVAKLERETAQNNKNITDGLQELINVLNEMKRIECELPPGCATQ